MFKVNNKKHLNNVNVGVSTVDFGLINISWVRGSVILSLLNPLSNFSDKKYIYIFISIAKVPITSYKNARNRASLTKSIPLC